MDARLEQRLKEMLDRQDIHDCLVRYCRGMDRLDRALVLSAYHPDALDHHGAFLGGPEAFWDEFGHWHATYNKGHQHGILNHHVELDGDVAHSETYWLFQGINQDDSVSLHGGRYLDRFERRGGDWRIATRVCIVEWHGRLGEVQMDPAFRAAQELPGIARRDPLDRSYERPLRAVPPT